MSHVADVDIGSLVNEYAARVDARGGALDDAARHRILEDCAVLGVSVYIALSLIDYGWRAAMFGGRVEYDPAEDQEITNYLRTWLGAAERLLIGIDEQETRGRAVKWSDRFRQAYREAKAALTPDAEIFADDALVELRDAAIDEHNRGETVVFDELGTDVDLTARTYRSCFQDGRGSQRG